MKKAWLGLLLLLTGGCYAKELGVWGDLYPIQEQDMLAMIQQRLEAMARDGSLAREQDNITQRVQAHIIRPPAVPGLRRVEKDATHYIDPTFTLDADIADHSGVVFAHKGDQVNPLTHVPFRETLYFIDADDQRQIAWMKQQNPDTLSRKIILVNGNIRSTGMALDSRVYFDQYGTLSRKFQLYAVPARVTMAGDGQRLRVDTFALK